MSNVPPSSRPPKRPANSSTPKTPTRRSSRDAPSPPKLKAVKVVQPMVTKGSGAGHAGGAEDGDGTLAEGPHSDMLEGHAELTEKAVASEHAQEELQDANQEIHEEVAAQEERAEAVEEGGEANQAGEQKGSTQETGKKPSAGAKQQPLKHEELSDGFGKTRMDSLRESLTKLEQAQKVAPGTQLMPTQRRQGNDALSALNSAQDPGVYFKELPQRGEAGAEEGAEDPELALAVEETRTLLADVKGVERVAAGEDEERLPVVLVFATRGFTHGSLARIPERVRRFATLLAVPYDLLPLRRAEL